MKSKILGLLAVGLLAGPMAANAIVITISGSPGGTADGQWDVSTISGTQLGLTNTLDDQVWWGNSALAILFTETLADGLGYPNRDGSRGPAFALCNDGCYVALGEPEGFRYSSTLGAVSYSSDLNQVYAIATRASVPEPGTLALLGLGLAGLGLSRRRKAA